MKTLQQIHKFKIATSSDSRNYKGTTKTFQIFPNRKDSNVLNFLVLGVLLYLTNIISSLLVVVYYFILMKPPSLIKVNI